MANNGGFTFRDTEFGEIVVRPKQQVRQVIFRVKEGRLQISCPIRYREQDAATMVELNRERLRQLFARVAKSAQRTPIVVGDRIPYYGGEVVLLPGIEGRGFVFKHIGGTIEVYCPQGYDLNDEPVWEVVSRYVRHYVKRQAQTVLPRRLEEVARQLAIAPVPVSIGWGRNALGYCSERGEIQLSYWLMFYPEEIIDYVICHELAHLTYMNHSPEFHALCNRYCRGRETELRRKARAFKVSF